MGKVKFVVDYNRKVYLNDVEIKDVLSIDKIKIDPFTKTEITITFEVDEVDIKYQKPLT